MPRAPGGLRCRPSLAVQPGWIELAHGMRCRFGYLAWAAVRTASAWLYRGWRIVSQNTRLTPWRSCMMPSTLGAKTDVVPASLWPSMITTVSAGPGWSAFSTLRPSIVERSTLASMVTAQPAGPRTLRAASV